MFRNFLLVCIVLATLTIQTQAISINELNGSPQFKNVYEKTYSFDDASSNRIVHFLNAYSVESLEYAAPRYKLKGTFYSVDERARGWAITEYELTATYDTNYSLGSLIEAQKSVKPSPAMYGVIKKAQDESGIQIELQGVHRYTWDGAVVNGTGKFVHESRPLERSRFDQDLFAIADAMFVVAYQQHFDDIVVK